MMCTIDAKSNVRAPEYACIVFLKKKNFFHKILINNIFIFQCNVFKRYVADEILDFLVTNI